jgi:hypothetical protein
MWLVLSNFQTFMTIHGLFLVEVFIIFGISQCVKITPSLASLGFYSIDFNIFSTIMMDESVYDQHVTIVSVYDQPVGDTKRRQRSNSKHACCWPCGGGACAAVGDPNVVHSRLLGHRYNPSEDNFTICIPRINSHTSKNT